VISLETLVGDEADILRRRGFQLLLLANVVPILGNGLVSPILDSLIEPMRVSPVEIGLIVSAFSAPAIVVIPMAGLLADRYGRKPVLVSGTLLFGVGGTGIAFTTDFRLVLAIRLVQGVGFAGISPIVITSIGDFYDGAREATAQGLRFSVSGASLLIFPILAGGLVTVAWFYPFFLYAISFPIAALLYLYFQEPAAKARGRGSDEGNIGMAVRTDESQVRAVLEHTVHPRLLGVVLARGTTSIVWIGYVTYVSILVVQLIGRTPMAAGVLVGIASLSFTVSSSQVGRVTDAFASQFSPLLLANVCLGLGFVVVMIAPNVLVVALGTVVMGIGFGTALGFYRSIISGLSPLRVRGGVVSLAEANGRLMATVTPIFMGGAISAGTPVLGFGPAVRATGIAATVLGIGFATLCVFFSSRAREPAW